MEKNRDNSNGKGKVFRCYERARSLGEQQLANTALFATPLQVPAEANGVSGFKATPMPNFAAAHANVERLNRLRRQRIQITIPTTPELMKRPKNAVSELCTRWLNDFCQKCAQEESIYLVSLQGSTCPIRRQYRASRMSASNDSSHTRTHETAKVTSKWMIKMIGNRHARFEQSLPFSKGSAFTNLPMNFFLCYS